MTCSTPWTQDAYLKAWDFACLAHHGQTYIGPSVDIVYDYINHPAGVAMEVIHALAQQPAYDGDLAIQCALLHDTLEDTAITYEQLVAEFGQAVADGVKALSKNEQLPKAQRMQDSLQRIVQQPQEVWMVKLADRINNLQYVPAQWSAAKIASYQQEAQLILTTLQAASPSLAQRLAKHIQHYGQGL